MKDANILFSDFKNVLINTPLTHGDLLESKVGQRHRGLLLTVATKIWPRWFFRAAMKNSGLFMMIEAKK